MRKKISDAELEQNLVDYVDSIELSERIQVETLSDEHGLPYVRIGEWQSNDFNILMSVDSELIAKENAGIQVHLTYIDNQMKKHFGKRYIHKPKPAGIAYKLNNKIRYKFLGQKGKFKKLVHAKTLERFIYQFDSKILFKFCFSYCGRGGTRQAVTYRLHNCYLNQGLIQQVKDDELHHLLPLIITFGASPTVLKKKIGKSTWRRLCQNTVSRNQAIVTVTELAAITATEYQYKNPLSITSIQSACIEYKTFIEQLYLCLPRISQLKSGLLTNKVFKNLFDTRDWSSESLSCYEWINNNAKVCVDTSVWNCFELYNDTAAYTVINPKWSYRRMQDEHDKGVKRANEERLQALEEEYKKPKYNQPLFSTTITGDIDGVQIKLLNTELDYIHESLAMEHCIYDGYWWEAKRKEIVAFSLKSSQQRTSIAFEFNCRSKKINYKPFQHYGINNSTVTCDVIKKVIRSKQFRMILTALEEEISCGTSVLFPSAVMQIQLPNYKPEKNHHV